MNCDVCGSADMLKDDCDVWSHGLSCDCRTGQFYCRTCATQPKEPRNG